MIMSHELWLVGESSILAQFHTALGKEIFALWCGAAVSFQEVVGLVRFPWTVVACGQQEKCLFWMYWQVKRKEYSEEHEW